MNLTIAYREDKLQDGSGSWDTVGFYASGGLVFLKLECLI